jgi:hypothetical protein
MAAVIGLIRMARRITQALHLRHPQRVSPNCNRCKSGTLPLPAETGWRCHVPTIRMQLQVFTETEPHGLT